MVARVDRRAVVTSPFPTLLPWLFLGPIALWLHFSCKVSKQPLLSDRISLGGSETTFWCPELETACPPACFGNCTLRLFHVEAFASSGPIKTRVIGCCSLTPQEASGSTLAIVTVTAVIIGALFWRARRTLKPGGRTSSQVPASCHCHRHVTRARLMLKPSEINVPCGLCQVFRAGR